MKNQISILKLFYFIIMFNPYELDIPYRGQNKQCRAASDATEWGAQLLSGRVLDSRPKGRGFEPHRRHCVVVIEQDTFILA